MEDGTKTLSWGNDFIDVPIESLYLGKNISYYLSNSPFKDKATLTSLIIGNSVTTIDNSAFMGCGVTSLIIPNSVISIGNYAFADCNFLKELFVNNPTPATIL